MSGLGPSSSCSLSETIGNGNAGARLLPTVPIAWLLPRIPRARERVLESYRVHRHDVEDAINQLLGRDPEQHRPPRLSWEPLIELLACDGISVTEQELLAMPFVFEFTDELLAELAAEER